MTENNKTNPRVAALKESATLQIADVARKIERQGDQVMKFQTGDPDFDSPKEVVDAAHKALVDGHTHYSDTRGLPELRNALADKLSKDNSIQYDPDREILVTHGASHGIFSCLQTLLQPSDEVLILSPSWMTYASSVTISGGIPVEVPSDPRESFMPNMESLNSLVTTRTKVLIINSPNNPSGFVIPRDLMNLLADFAERHDLTVISDEVYEKLTYDGLKHVSFASLPNMKERTITVNSFSKTYAMSGWRIGYLAGPQEIIKNVLKITQCSGTNVPPYSQKAAIVALNNENVAKYVTDMISTYSMRRNQVANLIEDIPDLKFISPGGAFYYLIDISAHSKDSTEFALQLLNKKRVAVVPGVSFGQCTEGWIRMTFATDQEVLRNGLYHMKDFLSDY